MNTIVESEVSEFLSQFFHSRGLEPLGKLNAFNHVDDSAERSFEIDLAIGPTATKGERSYELVEQDKTHFGHDASLIDRTVNELIDISLFPKDRSSIRSWRREPNPNPVVGIAVEIENTMSKYFLGSLLAAAIAGRWGIVIIPDCPEAPRWINTIERMMHKGSTSPIPSNVAVFTWPQLQQKIKNS